MTEPPNDATTPLSRMRFSWQRGEAPAPAPAEQETSPQSDDPSQPDDWQTEPAGPAPDASPAPPPGAHSASPAPPSQPVWSAAPRAMQAGPSVDTAPSPPETGVPRFDPTEPPPPVRQEPPPSARRDSGRTSGNGKAERRSGRKQKKGKFDVPPPGGRFSGGRGTHTVLRVVLVLTSCLLALGIVAYVAFSFGIRAMQNNTYQLAQSDIDRYGLTEFPNEQAGQFAADFVRLCLSHSMAEGAADAREQRLRSYVSDGVDSTCGWNGTGTQVVHDSTWTGASEPIELPGFDGKARMMTVRALTSTGSEVVSVPVYVEDLRTGTGMRIVGDIGEMPQPLLADVPEVLPNADDDTELSAALSGESGLFTQFFTAWGASDEALLRLVSPGATTAAKGGLDDLFTDPEVLSARVFLPERIDPADEFEWETGDTTEAWVWVLWRSPNAGDETTETRAYRLQLVKTANASNPGQEWAVRDIRGGVPDVEGN